ncbi:MAG TPA: triose-phosphate isomerase [Candidatus Udaeobacter sp.]|jgi:triosephosphate isomerase|nr:triose-phosphate isomerase [Candidatus Udaeobacter sp.]
MRKKIVAANWKMNMTQAESARFVESMLLDLGEMTDVEVVIIPPFTAIAKVMESLGKAQNIKVGAQNMYWEKRGAFTGEISAALLRDLFVHYVVLGHSERRNLFGETDEIVNRKVRAAHEATLRPIVCVGETLEQRDKGNVQKILSIQLRGSLAGLSPKELQDTVIAYEPVWAIGTGRNATPAQAQEAHAFIRNTLLQMSDDTTADRVRILYGGSVKPENAAELMSQPDIDGALVGGASLDPRSFVQIVNAARDRQDAAEAR